MRSVVPGLVAAVVAAGPLVAQEPDWTEVRARRQADGVSSLLVEVEFLAGDFRVGRAEGGLLYDTHLRYDASRLRPVREWSAEDGVGRLKLTFEGLGEDGDFDFEADEHGFLTLGLSPDVPIDLQLTVGAAQSDLDLGGIPLARLAYRTGASTTEIDFPSANPVRMSTLDLAVGAAEFEANRLGNARFDRLSLKGGVGEMRLDFGGEWEGDAEVSVEMGLGSLTLVVPSSLGVRIRKSGFLAALDAAEFDRVEGTWRTPNWDTARYQLDIELRAAFGSIEVVRAP